MSNSEPFFVSSSKRKISIIKNGEIKKGDSRKKTGDLYHSGIF
jgi:hypothetical protein